MSKTIVTCAVTGAGDTVKKSSFVPVTPAQIASECLAAAAAGAAIVHIHVRDPATGAPSGELQYYREVVDRIRQTNPAAVLNLTTGIGARYVPSPDNPRIGGTGTTLSLPAERVAHILELKPDICTLDVGSFNFGESAFLNIPGHLREMARLIKEARVKPECEVFDLGHVRFANQLLVEGLIEQPPLFQICLGIPWAAPATAEALLAMKHMLPRDAFWSAFAIGRQQFPFVAVTAALGGHVRVGLEDNLYLDRGQLSPGNAPLVKRAVELLELMGAEIASSDDARQILDLGSGE